MRIHVLAPLIIVVVFLAAYQASSQLADVVAVLIFGFLGWAMKRCGWPRPPLLLGFLLGDLIERYLFVSVRAYGASFLARPLVGVIFAVTIVTIVYSALQERKARQLSGD